MAAAWAQEAAGRRARRLTLANLVGRQAPARSAVEIAVEAHDLQAMSFGRCILVCVIEIQVESASGVDNQTHIRSIKRQTADCCLLQVCSEPLKCLVLGTSKEQESDRV